MHRPSVGRRHVIKSREMKQPVHESDVEAQSWYAGTDREIRGKALSDAQVDAALASMLKPGDGALVGDWIVRFLRSVR